MERGIKGLAVVIHLLNHGENRATAGIIRCCSFSCRQITIRIDISALRRRDVTINLSKNKQSLHIEQVTQVGSEILFVMRS